ncbi:MAG: hypothetical protein ACK56I_37615 [bacterium]
MRALPLSRTVSALMAVLKLSNTILPASASDRLRSTTGSCRSTGTPSNSRSRTKSRTRG